MLLADRSGLEAVTMRATASALQLAPAGLYRYVASRNELVEAMVDRALEDVTLPGTTDDVMADLVALTGAQVAVIRRHPWLVETLSTVRPGPTAIRMLEQGLRTLAPSAATSTAKLETLALLTGVATLFARTSAEPPRGTIEALSAATATHPHLAAAFAHPGTPFAPDDLLRRTVEALVRGLLP
jgi:AcrR family transcriptional regulator